MPYVQRNWRGEITGLFGGCQPEYATELLPDDHPDIVAFREKHPTPEWFLKPITEEDSRRLTEQSKRIDAEHLAIRNAVVIFSTRFSELEMALGALLYSLLNLPNSQIAYAIYYSPTSFDARAELVGNALIQIATEQPRLVDLLTAWKTISDKIRTVRILRNAVAHSSPLTQSINGKQYARLSPPAFDVIRVGRKVAKRQIPGLSSHDISEGIKKVIWIKACLDHVNRLVAEFNDGNPSLQEKYDALKAGLTKPDNL